MTPVYPVRVVLDSDQHRVPLVAAKSPEEARVRALGLGFGKRRVARVEQEEAGMTSERPGEALAQALADNGYVDHDSTEQYRLVDVLPILAALRSRGYEVRAAEPVRLSPDGDLRAALERALREFDEMDVAQHGTWIGTATEMAKHLRAALAAPATPPSLDAALDVERLARAMRWAGVRSEPDFATIEEAARQVASDYDALPKFGYVARLSGDQQAAEDRERP